jgi:hypothetical protein
MFVTVGLLQGDVSGRVTFASAGHPAILHYQKKTGTMREYPALDPPLGIAERQEFSESAIQCGVEDVLLVLTDGLTEVFDAKSNEMGLEPVQAALQESCACAGYDSAQAALSGSVTGVEPDVCGVSEVLWGSAEAGERDSKALGDTVLIPNPNQSSCAMAAADYLMSRTMPFAPASLVRKCA